MANQRKLDGIFGLTISSDTSLVTLIPVPWEVTTSYGSGTSRGPEAILAASPQIDLFDSRYGDAYTAGFFWAADSLTDKLRKQNDRLKPLAEQVIAEWSDEGRISSHEAMSNLETVNTGCAEMVDLVYKRTASILAENKIPGVVGGDHSTPLGAIRAVCEKYGHDGVGILHIDAHADLRQSYQGFQFSHASIMRNVCAFKTPPKTLVQVGIRDFCQEEMDFINENRSRVHTHFDVDVKRNLFSGKTWLALCEQITSKLPQHVYISFDIDGLSPDLCPHTGTPVPGGLSFDQASFLLETVARSGRQIVGFDLNEVAPAPDGDEWDGNVGARILFQLCSWAAVTNRRPN